METIWCLFSIANEYDQPANNLVAWFKEKPSIELTAKCVGVNLSDDETIVSIAKIWQGKEARVGQTDYRLQKVKEKEILEFE